MTNANVHLLGFAMLRGPQLAPRSNARAVRPELLAL
jgi:hypothetical protein